MAAETHFRVGSTWYKTKEVHVRDSGAWRDVKELYVHDGTSWRLVHAYGFLAGTFTVGTVGSDPIWRGVNTAQFGTWSRTRGTENITQCWEAWASGPNYSIAIRSANTGVWTFSGVNTVRAVFKRNSDGAIFTSPDCPWNGTSLYYQPTSQSTPWDWLYNKNGTAGVMTFIKVN